ncbi:MAG: hypothetical protein LBJ32_01280, partial [Oscillospiraceae bacterium]|nr:hypothetical protein [Oscillospiraceae bacterium]
FKNSSAKKKILAFGASALVALGSAIYYLAKKLNSGEKKDDDSPLESDNESSIPSIEKITLIGDSKSGKTTFLTRMLDGAFFNNSQPTIGVNLTLMERTFSSDQKVIFNFWDTGCQELYRGLVPTYTRGASLVLIFIDLSKNIDQQLDTWFKTFKDQTYPETKAMVILSRSELATKNQDIESIKQIIAQKISDFGLNERVTLFKNPISSEKITNEEILKFENEMYGVIMPA